MNDEQVNALANRVIEAIPGTTDSAWALTVLVVAFAKLVRATKTTDGDAVIMLRKTLENTKDRPPSRIIRPQ